MWLLHPTLDDTPATFFAKMCSRLHKLFLFACFGHVQVQHRRNLGISRTRVLHILLSKFCFRQNSKLVADDTSWCMAFVRCGSAPNQPLASDFETSLSASFHFHKEVWRS